MSTEIIFESPSGTIWFHPESKIVHHKIHIYMYGDEFKDFLLTGTRLMAERNAQKWLSDDQTNMAISKEHMRWGDDIWFPETVKAGWKYWAIVKPTNLIGQMDLEKLANDYKVKGVETRFFPNVGEALVWLESF